MRLNIRRCGVVATMTALAGLVPLTGAHASATHPARAAHLPSRAATAPPGTRRACPPAAGVMTCLATGWGTPDGTAGFSRSGAPQAATGAVTSGVAGKCLDDNGGRAANGNKIDIYPCNGTPAQSWTVELDGTLQIAGKCLDVYGQSTSNGGHVDLYACNDGANQQWKRP